MKSKTFVPTAEDLQDINKLTRREFTADEVYTFSVILCDNEIDRDYERFTAETLNSLADMYIGKTGILDHKPAASNQTARIYSTEIVTDSEKITATGEPYTCLTAKAYMVRDDSNKSTILSIDAGILKEVSVGLAVSEVICSECGANVKASPCTHKKGQKGQSGIIHHLLKSPTDAYEWSFVAIPAQRNAGVTKTFQSVDAEIYEKLQRIENDISELKKENLKSMPKKAFFNFKEEK